MTIYRAAPGGNTAYDWVVVPDDPGAAPVMICDRQQDAQAEADRLNKMEAAKASGN